MKNPFAFKKPVILIIFVALIAAAGTWWWRTRSDPKLTFVTSPVKRGDIAATISSTGTIEPVEVVDVGAQVAGRIDSFGKDKDGKPIDYRSVVEEAPSSPPLTIRFMPRTWP